MQLVRADQNLAAQKVTQNQQRENQHQPVSTSQARLDQGAVVLSRVIDPQRGVDSH